MSDEHKHIDELFKRHLKGHKATAPENAWERLNSDLHGAPATRPMWIARAAAALILLLLAFAAGYFLADRQPAHQQMAEKSPAIEQQANQPHTGQNVIPENHAAQPALQQQTQKAQPATETSTQKTQPQQQKNLQLAENTTLGINHTSKKVTTQNTEKPNVSNETLPVETEPENINLQPDKTPARAEAEPAEQEITTAQAEPQQTPDQVQETPPSLDPDMLKKMLYGEDALADDLLNTGKQSVSRWSVGAQMSPVYSYRSLGGSSLSIPDESVSNDYFNDVEKGIVSMAGGISLDYRFSDRLSLGSGLYVSRIGQQNNDVLAYNNPDGNGMYKLATSVGTVTVNPRKFEAVIVEQQAAAKDSLPGDYKVNASMVQNLDYLEVPLLLKYKVISSKISINVMGGLSPGILVNNRSYFNVDGDKIQTGTTENINPVIYNSVLGMGFEYALSKKLSLNMEPTFKFSLSPVNSGDGPDYKPYSLSWFTGLSYKLY